MVDFISGGAILCGQLPMRAKVAFSVFGQLGRVEQDPL